ncbi:MAG: hypothetical protein GF353_01315 [Candidatus Lokiarchaeota archaeon]|nr:hypothetical protein [Candidatus Lokiarchaeota archaeon]
MNFEKGEDLYRKLNENNTISPFKFLFSGLFREKINEEAFIDECNQLKENLRDFGSFKEVFNKLHSKTQNFEALRDDFEEYQKLLDSGNSKLINEKSIEYYRLFRSFFPLDKNSEYVIDIINKTIVKL